MQVWKSERQVFRSVRILSRKAIVVIGCSLLLGLAGEAHAISAGCLPGGLPATPGPDAVGRAFAWFDEVFRGDVWRVACADNPNQIALLLRITPLNSTPFICSSSFTLVQAGQQIDPVILQTPSSSSFCTDLLVATTFSLERRGGPPFDPKGAFTLAHDSDIVRTLDVPAGGGAPELGITVVSTGCNPCRAGQIATFHIHTVNPGAPLGVDLRAGLEMPNNASVALFDLCTVTVVESGEHDIPLLSIIVPGNVPNGTYTVEAAILDPIFGATLSRHSLSVVKQ
jgi:hypothetical protein